MRSTSYARPTSRVYSTSGVHTSRERIGRFEPVPSTSQLPSTRTVRRKLFASSTPQKRPRRNISTCCYTYRCLVTVDLFTGSILGVVNVKRQLDLSPRAKTIYNEYVSVKKLLAAWKEER